MARQSRARTRQCSAGRLETTRRRHCQGALLDNVRASAYTQRRCRPRSPPISSSGITGTASCSRCRRSRPSEAARFRAAFEDVTARLGGRPTSQDLSQTHLYFPWAYELATHPAILDAVEAVLGPDLLVWTVSIFAKYPRDPGYISWHQDGTYWGLDSPQVTTAWVALTDSVVANGCMRVVPGSHTSPILPHKDTYAPNNLLSRGQEVQAEVDEKDAVDVVLQAGRDVAPPREHHPRLQSQSLRRARASASPFASPRRRRSRSRASRRRPCSRAAATTTTTSSCCPRRPRSASTPRSPRSRPRPGACSPRFAGTTGHYAAGDTPRAR